MVRISCRPPVAVDRSGGHRDGSPAQPVELPVEGRLVLQSGEDEVCILDHAQELGVVTLAVHGIGGHDDTGQRQWFQQRHERSDFVTLLGNLPLREHDPGVSDSSDQMRGTSAAGPRAPGGLAVHRKTRPRRTMPALGTAPRPALPGGFRPTPRLGPAFRLTTGAGPGLPGAQAPTCHPATQGQIQRIGVDPGAQVPDGLLVRTDIAAGDRIPAGTQRPQCLLTRPGDPLTDRIERATPRQHRRHRQQQHTRRRMANPACITRIRNLRQGRHQQIPPGTPQHHRPHRHP
jgi:hypothetical protein